MYTMYVCGEHPPPAAWLVKVEVGAGVKAELAALLDAAKYEAFCKSH
jgi:hypothetical protein